MPTLCPARAAPAPRPAAPAGAGARAGTAATRTRCRRCRPSRRAPGSATGPPAAASTPARARAPGVSARRPDGPPLGSADARVWQHRHIGLPLGCLRRFRSSAAGARPLRSLQCRCGACRPRQRARRFRAQARARRPPQRVRCCHGRRITHGAGALTSGRRAVTCLRHLPHTQRSAPPRLPQHALPPGATAAATGTGRAGAALHTNP